MNTIPTASQLGAQSAQILWNGFWGGIWMAIELFAKVTWLTISQHPYMSVIIFVVLVVYIGLRVREAFA